MNYKVRQFIIENNLQAGDAIVAKKIGYRILDHFIVYLGRDYCGHWFMANSMENGVRKYNENEVLELIRTFEPVQIRKFHGNQYARRIAVQRALSQEGQPYSLFGSNCEHFANYVQKGIKESPQVGNWVGVGFLALVFGALTFGNR
ncbi:lecithin retinol acyltransferase family protein [Fulvivirga sp.]|uniref:lecithin retinol acyltransferase family protein n=1 Tax=Fulvivirga sp. TaxID=1931237 RepID=UPI0032ED0DD1